MKSRLATYYPGILLFLFALVISMIVYQDYGISWDEPEQRQTGIFCYDYAFKGAHNLFIEEFDNHGAGFEFLLAIIEKKLNLTDSRDIYLYRHIATHIFFLLSALSLYILAYRLFRNQFLACLGSIMIAFAPRLYAHSYFNSKDIPFLSMFIFSFTFYQLASEKNKPVLYFIVGMLCGFSTSIRVMGVMLAAIISLFMVMDIITDLIKKRNAAGSVMNLLVFSAGFCLCLYAAWPALWNGPVHYFIESFRKMLHYHWDAYVLLNGKMIHSYELPLTYFPIWFLISNPVLWLFTGFTGLLFVTIEFFKRPWHFLQNTRERNFFLYLFCFSVPIFLVIVFHSVIYDDWRHLYFVYPPFVLMALYFIHKTLNSKYAAIVKVACLIQVGFLGYFMIRNHPFQEVYFNRLVSHDKEYLRGHYDLDYWGPCSAQALTYLLTKHPSDSIKVACDPAIERPMRVNIRLVQKRDRGRIQFTSPDEADYFVTDFRLHPGDYPYPNIEYSVSVLNSTILRIYRLR